MRNYLHSCLYDDIVAVAVAVYVMTAIGVSLIVLHDVVIAIVMVKM